MGGSHGRPPRPRDTSDESQRQVPAQPPGSLFPPCRHCLVCPPWCALPGVPWGSWVAVSLPRPRSHTAEGSEALSGADSAKALIKARPSGASLPRFYFESFVVVVELLSRVQLFATLWTVAPQAPLSMEFSRQEYCSGLPFPSLRDFSDPGIKPESLALTG